MRALHKHLPLAVAAAFVMAADPASATCRGAAATSQILVDSTIVVKQTGVVGETVHDTGTTRTAYLAICTIGREETFEGVYALPAGWSLNAGGTSVNTNLAGLGVRMTAKDRVVTNDAELSLGFQSKRTLALADGQQDSQIPATEIYVYERTEYALEFFRTAATINVGTMSDGTFARFRNPGLRDYRSFATSGASIVAAACSVQAGDMVQTVALGRHSVAALLRDGASPWVGFSFASDDCDSTQLANASFTFTAAADATDASLFQVVGGPTGLGLELEAQPAGGALAVLPNQAVAVPSLIKDEQYSFRARLKALPGQTPTAGQIDTPIQLNVTFM